MSQTHPSVASVARGRYWVRTLIRIAAAVLITVAVLRSTTWVVDCVFGSGLLSLFSLMEFWEVLAPVPVALVILLCADRFARWLLPMPRPVCPECGYAIQPATDRCPECGLRRDPPAQPPPPPAGRRI